MAGRRNQPSSIDRLPRELRELIGELRRDGSTIDEILAHLREMQVPVSRSALGRHVKGLAEVAERMQRSRQIAESLVDRFGHQSDNKLARLNLELMHGVVMQTLTAADTDPETGEVLPVTFSPEDAMFLARSLQSLASAEKITRDQIKKEREEAAKEATKAAAEKAVGAARAKGLTGDTIDAIRHAVLGTGG